VVGARNPELRHLVGLLVAGCESELELWGYTSVFNVAGLSDATRQRIVRVGGQTFRLDMAYEDEKVAVELDGRAYHASAARWESDIARDLALATIGWQTIRFSHRRLVSDPDGCRRDVLAVRAARRTQAS
jgi:very-short-patch-repair endonuclease